jgi:hypothetical protein
MFNPTHYTKNIEKIRKEYPNFNHYGDTWVVEIYSQICEEQLIKEFITQTIPLDKTLETLHSRFKEKYSKVLKKGHEHFTVCFSKIGQNQFLNIDEVIKFLDSFGWFPALVNGYKFGKNPLEHFIFNSKTIEIDFEPRYDLRIFPTENKIYHLTFDIHWNNIEDKGLTPKNKSKISNHAERIYFINEYNEREFDRLGKFLYNTLNIETKKYIKECYVLEINISELKKEKQFYRDPNYSLGIWTYENIPPFYIKVIEKIEINSELN